MILADKITEERKRNGWSQEELAEKLGVSRQAVSKWESAGSVPDLQRVIQLAELFGVETNYLLTEDEEFVAQASEEYGTRGRRQAEALVAELSGLFAGGELSDNDKDAVMIALQKAYFDCKADNRKYTPKKYKKDNE